MPLVMGARLGPYEVAAPLGAGGMGEVYRARDTKLNRDVALKVLPDTFALDPDRLARFKREAQVLASLNHPNIAAIYGFEESTGVQALVLELVEGPTLADRITQGAIPIEDALRIALQIAEALEAAHERGVVHRDLKPANVKITPDGKVKVLDFGLAKLSPGAAGEPGADNLTNSPTLSVHATHAGLILGTAAYMSPEQARGKPVDRRTDIWAFGCVLFEMLTGRRAFEGTDVTETIAAVVRAEPEWPRLPAETPAHIRTLLRRCLQKDPERRLPHIGVARIDIAEGSAEATQPVEAGVTAHGRAGLKSSSYGWLAAAVLLLTTLALAAALSVRQVPIDARVYRTSLLPPDEVATWSSEIASLRFVLSPDGRRLAFVAVGRDRRTMLWVRPLDSLAAQPLAGTDGAQAPFWSPDSRFIAFIADGKLKKIDVTGGPPITLAEAETGQGAGAWGPGDVILFAARANAGLFRISGSGGAPVPVTTLDSEVGETRHFWPWFLPDGRHFLYEPVGSKTYGASDPRAIAIGSLDPSEKSRVVLQGGSNAKYAQGHLLFMRERTLMAQPFDAARLELGGEPVPVAAQVQVGGATGTSGAFSVSETGILAYQTGDEQAGSLLTWFDRAGRQIRVVGDPTRYLAVELAPDAAQVAVVLDEPAEGGRRVWLIDLARGVRSRFTLEGDTTAAVWSADGNRILLNLRTKGALDLYVKASSGAGGGETMLADGSVKTPLDWSADGHFVLYGTSAAGTQADLWVLPLFGDRKPIPFLQTRFVENSGSFSPDGRWIAYRSNESGSPEVYVAPFPATGAKTLVSSGAASVGRIAWRRNGREMFYLAADNTLMAAEVDGREATLKVVGVKPLFKMRPVPIGSAYGVTGDGQQFLVNVASDEAASTPITLIVNWTAGLRRP